ncbi:hypothetical protein [Bosea sp. LC85]|nr:hypothetical protein [Bosea sp. LC85]
MLPTERASGRKVEHEQVNHAFQTLLAPHIDREALVRPFPQMNSAGSK